MAVGDGQRHDTEDNTMATITLYRRVGSTRWGRDVPITRTAVVDDVDYERVMAFGAVWRLHNHGYAEAKVHRDGCRVTLLLHRVVLGIEDPNVHVDHWDHDPLNNRRSNLRPGTQEDNNRNTLHYPRRTSSSRFKGVGRYRGGWRAYGLRNGKSVWIGKYPTEELARDAYMAWVKGQ